MRTKTIPAFYVSSGILLALLTGCSSTDPVRVEQDFGNSVHHMIQAQIYNPQAARNPSTVPPAALDGPMAGNALDVYRKDVAKPSQGNQGSQKSGLPMNILIGQ
jgi:type IV pilus biogenesis protein CpaD/CtpE